jgi:hypothetical protein
MRRSRYRSTGISIVGALCAALSGCAWIEESNSHFADRQDAEEAKMFATGWLPVWLPASSVHLREKHDIDTNASILRFEYDPAKETPPFGEACEPIAPAHVECPRLGAGWWPETETIRSMPRLYDCRSESGYLAVPAEGGVAYFWRISA